jgi:hypothetical protein
MSEPNCRTLPSHAEGNDQSFFAHPLDQHPLTPSNIDQQTIPDTSQIYWRTKIKQNLLK